MDPTKIAFLTVEAMGKERLSSTQTSGCGTATGMEHRQVGPRPVAFEREPRALPRIAEQVFYRLGAAGIGGTMNRFNLKRRGTYSVCPVLWEERRREVSPHPD
jgi:hypothetical protein